MVLDQYDMASYNLCWEQLCSKDPNLNEFITKLFPLIRLRKDVDINKLDIDAYSNGDKGCTLYISSSKTSRAKRSSDSSHTIVVCECEDLDTLAALCRCLYKIQKDTIHDAQLFVSNKKYHLVLFVFDEFKDKIYPIISEYAETVNIGEIHYAKAKEHLKCLIEKGALKLIVNTL